MKITDSQFKKLYLEQQGSSSTVSEFCSTHKISVSTFYRKKKILEYKQSVPSFIALDLIEQPSNIGANKAQTLSTIGLEPSCNSSLEFTFPNGTKLQVKGNIDTDLLRTIAHLY